jgi:hypothetical protein
VIDPLAIALQGIGFGPAQTVAQGLLDVPVTVVTPPQGGGAAQRNVQFVREMVTSDDEEVMELGLLAVLALEAAGVWD